MRLVILTLLFASVLAISASEWRGFRGNDGLATSTDKDVPSSWSATEKFLWKSDLPGAGSSTPILIGERIFLACYSGYNVPGQPRGQQADLKRHLLCLDRGTGKILWKRDIPCQLPEQETIRDDHGYATNTPVADAKRVFAFFGKSGVFAFDHDGKQLWQADVGDGLSGWGSAASLVLDGDRLIVNASVESEALYALDATTGKQLWKLGGIRESWNTPILVPHGGRTELVLAYAGKVIGVDPATGKQRWHCATDIPWYMVPSLVAADGVVFALGGRPGGGLAVKLGGTGDVTKTHRLWTSKKGTNVSSPVYHEDHLYWMHDNTGIAYCASAKTGEIVYEQRIPRADQVYGSATLADGKIFYPARNGVVYVLAAKPKYELLATNTLGERGTVNSSLAIAGSRIFLRTDKAAYCIGGK
jgi:outer membrane protein assembly factor BamB